MRRPKQWPHSGIQDILRIFSGAGWVLFKKTPSRTEALNDRDSDLISFYRVVQNHLEEFIKQFRWLLVSREHFEDWKVHLAGRGLTDIQKAARYYYIQRMAFGGRVRNRSYGVQFDGRTPRLNLLRIEEEMSQIHLRLAHVQIENLSWQNLIPEYDRPETVFYCDPPYYKCKDYQHNFVLEDFKALAKTLARIKGKFMLSINAHPAMRNVFKDFTHQEVSLIYSVSRKNPRRPMN